MLEGNSAQFLITEIRDSEVIIGSSAAVEVRYDRLKQDFKINRSIPILGKWDPTAWEPCSKPSQNPG